MVHRLTFVLDFSMFLVELWRWLYEQHQFIFLWFHFLHIGSFYPFASLLFISIPSVRVHFVSRSTGADTRYCHGYESCLARNHIHDVFSTWSRIYVQRHKLLLHKYILSAHRMNQWKKQKCKINEFKNTLLLNIPCHVFALLPRYRRNVFPIIVALLSRVFVEYCQYITFSPFSPSSSVRIVSLYTQAKVVARRWNASSVYRNQLIYDRYINKINKIKVKKEDVEIFTKILRGRCS